jgi:AhpC/TSA family
VLRAPVDSIPAPQFPSQPRWLNLDGRRLRIEQLRGRPFLVEFWDFCRPNSIRTLPYVKAWHQRYRGGEHGLTVIGVHSPGFEPSHDPDAVARAVRRLGIEHPVLLDGDLQVWREYENLGWPARYLFDSQGMLYHYHYGEGAYEETELAIQELLPIDSPHPQPLHPLRPEDAPAAELAAQTEDQEGAYCGPYEAGGVWAVLDGTGTLTVNGGPASGGSEIAIAAPGAYPLVEHERHTAAVIAIEVSDGVRCLATCFTPGVA